MHDAAARAVDAGNAFLRHVESLIDIADAQDKFHHARVLNVRVGRLRGRPGGLDQPKMQLRARNAERGRFGVRLWRGGIDRKTHYVLIKSYRFFQIRDRMNDRIGADDPAGSGILSRRGCGEDEQKTDDVAHGLYSISVLSAQPGIHSGLCWL